MPRTSSALLLFDRLSERRRVQDFGRSLRTNKRRPTPAPAYPAFIGSCGCWRMPRTARSQIVQSGRLGGGQRDTRWRVVASVSVVDRPTLAKDCLPGSVAGARRVLGSRRDRPRRKLGTEPTDRPTSSERGNHHSPLRDPAAAASRTAATAHDRVSHPTRADGASWRTSHPRKSSPAISTSIVLRPKARSSWAVRRRCSASGERSRPPEGAPRTTSIISSRQRRSMVSESSCSRRISAIDRRQGRTRTRAPAFTEADGPETVELED